MAVDSINRAVAPESTTDAKPMSPTTDSRRIAGRNPVIALVRSLAMVAVAALAILVLLPAAIAAQAASTL